MRDKCALEVVEVALQASSPVFSGVEGDGSLETRVLPLSPDPVPSSYQVQLGTPRSVSDSIREGVFLASIDPEDAYYQVPIHRSSRRYLRFAYQGTACLFKALCFGLATAP